MILLKGFVIKDNHDNIYLETIRSTRDRSITVFMKKVNLGANKNKWASFLKSGYKCLNVTLKVKDLSPNKSKPLQKKSVRPHSTTLRLPLNPKFFILAKSGAEKEDYREINTYWIRMLVSPQHILSTHNENDAIKNFKKNPDTFFRKFLTNRATIGYPKLGDTAKTVNFVHAGIKIKNGREDLGLDPEKLYFVIRHGKRIKNEKNQEAD